MEFLKANLLNTTTQISVNSNTTTAENLINRDPIYQYYSLDFANDLTTTTIQITFDQTTAVSRIALFDTNFKEFTIYYNGSTANTFSLTNSDTTSSNYTANSDTNKFFRFSTIQCSSITIDAKKTITANQEKILGNLLISDLYFDLTTERKPSAKNYKPKLKTKQIVHTLADGGTRIHNIKKKWDLDFSLEYISQSTRDSLYSIYSLNREFNFCPFGTATSWDGICFEAVWDGEFGFYEFADNPTSAGFSGKVSLKETPT